MSIEDLQLQAEILRAIKALGFTEATSIQQRCIPEIRAGRDLVGQSSTGSGKTAAFGLPLLEKIQPGQGLQLLILTPTRELCVQVSEALRDFSKFTHIRTVSVFGGVGIGPQIDAIKKADIVVGTPGRILDHMERRTIHFGKTRYVVLDEADKMFEMGFVEDVERIISQVPKERQTLLFSATISTSINHLIKKFLRNPVTIKSETQVAKHLLKQTYYVVKKQEKFSVLTHFAKQNHNGLSIVFCGTRHGVDQVARNLKSQGIKAMAIHGGLTQNKRMHALDQLKKENIHILVATDVAARGLDIKHVAFVYNYDVPKTAEEYVHRIGRTARAGAEGDAITLLSENDYENFNRVLSDKTLHIKKGALPHFEKVAFKREDMGRAGGERGSFGGRSRFGGRPSSAARPSPGGRYSSAPRGRNEDFHRPRFGSRSPSYGRR
ncbi:DEAD/DEAH box helicase [Candidatus Woesearchaeota archaeon]|nr:DEAD/DEAH box helicase [Candidatus Woesearchaeota archaeon]